MRNVSPKIFVIILNWNGRNDTLECLGSVLKIDYCNYEVVVVDNGSQDDSVKAIKDEFPQIKIIENQENRGYAGGNNEGIKYALSQNAEYVFLLNNDTIVDSQILINFLQASQECPEAGTLGAKIYFYYEANKIWYAGAEWVSNEVSFKHIGYGKLDDGKDWEEIRQTEYACGCALLIKSETIKKIGLLEEKYFVTWEEVDLCFRAKQAGYKCIFVPQSKVWHKISCSFPGGANGPRYQYFWWRNRLLWIERNLPAFEIISIYAKSLLRIIYYVWLAYSKTDKRNEGWLVYRAQLIGVRDYLLRHFGNVPSRVYDRK